MARIGFIGLGHMGLPMALNLLKAGYEVTAYDVHTPPLLQFANAGGAIASDIEQLSVNQDTMICMLPSGQHVLEVCKQLFKHLKASALFIDCSTVDVQTSRTVNSMAEALHIEAIDAPVSGGTAGAAAGSLTFMVGGSSAAFDRAYPVLQAMGQKIIHTGEAGSGQAAKICNNMILGISMIAVSEAFALAQKLHLSPLKLHEVVTNSSGQCWSMSNYTPMPHILENVPANKDYQPGFAAQMMLKDLLLSQNEARCNDTFTPLGAQATALYQQFVDEGHALRDFSGIINLIMNHHEAEHE